MIRRRRRTHEIPFSFDSFLDIVANVVGIILRLILVVWVGARSYSALKEMSRPKPTAAETVLETRELEDPLRQELDEHRRELARLQQQLLSYLRAVQEAKEPRRRTESQLAAVTGRRQQLAEETSALQRENASHGQAVQAAALSLDELHQRREKLRAELRELEQLPASTKALRYRTPVSQPVHAEQLMFELRQGRIAFVDIAALLAEVRLGLADKAEQLRTTRQVHGVAGPVGTFRLHYTLERERGLLDSLGAASTAETSFRYGLSEWHVEPITPARGETADQALAAGSAFRQIVDPLDPRQSVVTIWVYPDSFAAYRKLRDHLHDRALVVAGRPLPAGARIAASPQGSVSRGQ